MKKTLIALALAILFIAVTFGGGWFVLFKLKTYNPSLGTALALSILWGAAAFIVGATATQIGRKTRKPPAKAELLKRFSITKKPMGSQKNLTPLTTICALSVGTIIALIALMYFFNIQNPQ